MTTRHKLIGRSTYTGSDTLKFYDAGDGDVYIVHVQEWADLDSSAVAEYGKYNAIAHHVNVCGFDNFVHSEGSYEAKHGQQPSHGVGYSVHASLRSSGLELTGHAEGCFDLGLRAVERSHDGDEIASFGDAKTVKLVIADAMYGYGAGDRVHDDSGNNARRLEREARNSF